MSENTQEDFQRIRERLSAYYRRHEIDMWLRSPHPQLDGQRACDLIHVGRSAEVEAIIDRLDSASFI